MMPATRSWNNEQWGKHENEWTCKKSSRSSIRGLPCTIGSQKSSLKITDLHATLYELNTIDVELPHFGEMEEMMYRTCQIPFSLASNQEVSVTFKMRSEWLFPMSRVLHHPLALKSETLLRQSCRVLERSFWENHQRDVFWKEAIFLTNTPNNCFDFKP